MKKPGDCAYRDDAHGGHRWVIAAIVGNYVLLVNITSIKPDVAHDPACVIGNNDWDVLTHASYAIYQLADLMTMNDLATELDSRAINIYCSVPAPVLVKIQQGFLTSVRANPRHKKFMASCMPPAPAAAPAMPPAAQPRPASRNIRKFPNPRRQSRLHSRGAA